MMDIQIDFQSGIPLYQQIAQEVRELISAGKLAPGTQLPTVRQLAVQLGINFNTVARAYRSLDQEGMISTQHGRGTFILNPDKGEQRTAQKKVEELTRFYIQKATRLGYKPEEIKECFESMVQEKKDQNQP
jgi:GntR family transcriptional regulator